MGLANQVSRAGSAWSHVHMTATVTVIGMDGPDLPPDAVPMVAKARVVVGRRSTLQAYAEAGEGAEEPYERRTIELTGSADVTQSTLDELAAAVDADEPAVVLTRGDPGYFGVLRALRARGLPTVSRPSVSSLQRLAAMIQRPWDDVSVVSARGRDFRRAVNVCRARRAVAVLTAPGAGPAELGAALDGWRRTLVVVDDLCGQSEELSTVDTAQAAARAWREPNIVLSLADTDALGTDSWFAGGELTPPATGWALADNAFAHREGLVTAPEVRAMALAKLAPRPGVLVWDVVAGSGSMGIEAGRLGAAVIAVENDPGLCVRIVANAAAHGVDVRLVDGDVPDRLVGLPQPDAVFLGSPRADVVRHCAGVGAARIVVHVRELDSVGPARDALLDAGYTVDGCQLSAAPLEGLASGGAAVGATSPTVLLWGTRTDVSEVERG